ncbi:hypothetical protein GCM10010402_73410 [Actinomadura luteofluorescens]|uniref:DUF397 domain-containing protein n=1 Tax=Actinomadura luteofluorescens TaxID=46163 RepID=A0A7Y9EL38_9ACTN|nr:MULTISPECIES: DUF397 domain-containing protein [Actinomadura]MCR3741350.1 protein of unknown function (DUF397) [Actinomadura glauciflava]NYD49773.1 hypothetical protein [Actinomadura luteofluorescens]
MELIKWRKARRSEAQGDACVELARLPGGIGVRDSKAPDAGHLALSRETFRKLVEQCR